MDWLVLVMNEYNACDKSIVLIEMRTNVENI